VNFDIRIYASNISVLIKEGTNGNLYNIWDLKVGLNNMLVSNHILNLIVDKHFGGCHFDNERSVFCANMGK
jgi:hypothetical protein